MKKIFELISLDGRVAIVTGGAGHVGLAVCETLLELGARVVVLDLDPEACKSRCDLLNKKFKNGLSIPVAADLSDEDHIKRAVTETIGKTGTLNILVHAAAFVGTTKFPGWAEPFGKQTLEAWDAAMRVNLSSIFVLTQTAAPFIEESGNGSIIFLSSIYGISGPDNRLYQGTDMVTPAGYAASKGGLMQFGRYLSTVLAPQIRVNTISAGGVWRGQPDEFYQRYIGRTPLRRMATEEDFKGAVAYLASDLSRYVTGENLVVDGGWTAW